MARTLKEAVDLFLSRKAGRRDLREARDKPVAMYVKIGNWHGLFCVDAGPWVRTYHTLEGARGDFYAQYVENWASPMWIAPQTVRVWETEYGSIGLRPILWGCGGHLVLKETPSEEAMEAVLRVLRAWGRFLDETGYETGSDDVIGGKLNRPDEVVRFIEAGVPFEIGSNGGGRYNCWHDWYYVPAEDRVFCSPGNAHFTCLACGAGPHVTPFNGWGNLSGLQAQALRGETPDLTELGRPGIRLRADGYPMVWS